MTDRQDCTEAVVMACRLYNQEMADHGDHEQAVATAFDRADEWLDRQSDGTVGIREALWIQFGKLSDLMAHTEPTRGEHRRRDPREGDR